MVIIPSGKVISWSNLQKIQEFHDNGGRVIATTQLPFKSSEFGHDAEVRRAITTMFGLPPSNTVAAASDAPNRILNEVSDLDESLKPFQTRSNGKGGKAYFVPHPTAAALQSILDDALDVPDVDFENAPQANSGGGMLSYLHKVKNGADIYYFANSSNDRVDTWVRLRGRRTLQRWDPHSGVMTPAECLQITEKGQDITRFHLVLEPVHSVFLTEPRSREPLER